MVIKAVNGTDVTGIGFGEVVQMIKAEGRPLRCAFQLQDAVARVDGSGRTEAQVVVDALQLQVDELRQSAFEKDAGTSATAAVSAARGEVRRLREELARERARGEEMNGHLDRLVAELGLRDKAQSELESEVGGLRGELEMAGTMAQMEMASAVEAARREERLQLVAAELASNERIGILEQAVETERCEKQELGTSKMDAASEIARLRQQMESVRACSTTEIEQLEWRLKTCNEDKERLGALVAEAQRTVTECLSPSPSPKHGTPAENGCARSPAIGDRRLLQDTYSYLFK
eukprot:TRINITY_DN6201_c0_g1_i4.p1 TRINITY_DN6201_c0_g1~~TRINITY_DN6201_c0_g1_i4.p1  ORF type:complete len:291 (+),score=66.55 TRINITY_DN6201_c0_g1_i4:425-1297(+)